MPHHHAGYGYATAALAAAYAVFHSDSTPVLVSRPSSLSYSESSNVSSAVLRGINSTAPAMSTATTASARNT